MDIFLTVLLILLAVVFLSVGICLFTKLRVKITFEKKSGEKTVFKATLEAMGGLVKKNLSDFKGRKSSKSKKKQKTGKAKRSPGQTDRDEKKKISSYYQTFCKIKHIFSLSKHKVRKNILTEKLRLNVDFGLDDAAHTGIATGSLWAGIYNVIAFISTIARLNEPEITVNPDFENEKLAFDGECIIVLRLANIINILFVIGINYHTFKNKEKAAINYGNTD